MDLMVCPAQTDEHCSGRMECRPGHCRSRVEGGAERGAHHVDLDVALYNGWWSILLLGMIYSYRYLGKSCQLALVI